MLKLLCQISFVHHVDKKNQFASRFVCVSEHSEEMFFYMTFVLFLEIRQNCVCRRENLRACNRFLIIIHARLVRKQLQILFMYRAFHVRPFQDYKAFLQ